MLLHILLVIAVILGKLLDISRRQGLPFLLGHLDLEDKTVEYVVKWKDETKYLLIDAVGNLAGFYIDGKLVSDFYLYGDRWVIDLRRFDTREGRIKIQPLTEEERGKIYLEYDMPLGVHAPKVFGFDGEIVKI